MNLVTNYPTVNINQVYNSNSNSNAPKVNWFNAFLAPQEKSKYFTVRLLPFDNDFEHMSFFKKIHYHNVEVNDDIAKKFNLVKQDYTNNYIIRLLCNNKNDSLGDNRCPYCLMEQALWGEYNKIPVAERKTTMAIQAKAIHDNIMKYQSKEQWVVRLIDRDHENEGVKYFRFNNNRKGEGIYDKIQTLANLCLQKDNVNIFDLNQGKDIIICATRGNDGKVNYTISEGTQKPLHENLEIGMKWINDVHPMNEIFSVKPSEYVEIIGIQKKTPIFDKTLNRYVAKEEQYAESNNELRTAMETNQTVVNQYQQNFNQVGVNQPYQPTPPNPPIPASAPMNIPQPPYYPNNVGQNPLPY